MFAKFLLKKYRNVKACLDCDLLAVRQVLETQNKDWLKSFIGNSEFVVIDYLGSSFKVVSRNLFFDFLLAKYDMAEIENII